MLMHWSNTVLHSACVVSTFKNIPESKIHGTNRGPTGDLSAPGGPHVGPIYLVTRDTTYFCIHNELDFFSLHGFSRFPVAECNSFTVPPCAHYNDIQKCKKLNCTYNNMLVSWFLASPGHLKPYFSMCRINRWLSFKRKDLRYLHYLNF